MHAHKNYIYIGASYFIDKYLPVDLVKRLWLQYTLILHLLFKVILRNYLFINFITYVQGPFLVHKCVFKSLCLVFIIYDQECKSASYIMMIL